MQGVCSLRKYEVGKISILLWLFGVMAYPFFFGNPYPHRWAASDYWSHMAQVTNGWAIPLYYWGDWFLHLFYYPLSKIGLSVGDFYWIVAMLAFIGACYSIYKFGTLVGASYKTLFFILLGGYGILEYVSACIIPDFIAMYILGMGYLYFLYKWVAGGKPSNLIWASVFLLMACLTHYKPGGELILGSGLFLGILLLAKTYRSKAIVSLVMVLLTTGVVMALYLGVPHGGTSLVGKEIEYIATGSGIALSTPLGSKTFLSWQFNPFSMIAVLVSMVGIVYLRKHLKPSELLPLIMVACFVIALSVGAFTTITRHPDRFGLDLSIFLCIGLAMMYHIITKNSDKLRNWGKRYSVVIYGCLILSASIIIPRYIGGVGSWLKIFA